VKGRVRKKRTTKKRRTSHTPKDIPKGEGVPILQGRRNLKEGILEKNSGNARKEGGREGLKKKTRKGYKQDKL